MTKRVIVFDLDGTLVHSVPDLHAAASQMLAEEGQPPLSVETIQSFVGNGVPKLVERVIGASGLDLADHQRLTTNYLAHYEAAPSDLSTLYPGVKECLRDLKAAGFQLGLCTNKPQKPAVSLMRDFELAAYFDTIVGGDALPVRKPDPRHLFHTFEQLGAKSGIYVGDSETDNKTALDGSIPFAFFTKGYRKAARSDFTYEFAFEHFSQFTDWAMANS